VLKGTIMRNRHIDTHQKVAIIRSVASKLHAAEEAIDLAIIKICELNSELPAARLGAKLSATVCQPAFDLSASALQNLILCRSQTVQAHEVLAQTQRDMGLGAHAMGDGWKTFQSDTTLPLQLVVREAA
jgi:hypothetical protein